MAGTLDGMGQSPLVFGAVAGDASADDFSLFSQKLAEAFDILVIDGRHLLTAKSADPPPEEAAAARPRIAAAGCRTFGCRPQKGTSSSGDSSSFEISMRSFAGAAPLASSDKGSSGSWIVASPAASRPPRPRN